MLSLRGNKYWKRVSELYLSYVLILQTIATSFELFAPETDIVVQAFRQLADQYNDVFSKAFKRF